MPILIAHGAVGILDELLPLLAIGLFLVLMFSPLVYSWLNKQKASSQPAGPAADPQTPATLAGEAGPKAQKSDDHFRLE